MDLGTAKRLFCESPSWSDVVENTVADFVNGLENRDEDLLAILRIGHDRGSAERGCLCGMLWPELDIVNSVRVFKSRTCCHI